jgi:hypothetical protein
MLHILSIPPLVLEIDTDWSDGKLVIAGNRGRIHLLQAAFYAVKLEVQRRDAVVCEKRRCQNSGNRRLRFSLQ